jgi:16S rRNA (guanine527-N7)-methyltransferase
MSRTEPSTGSRSASTSGDEARRLHALASEHVVPLDDAQARALLTYSHLLLTWSARINLTGARSIAALIDAHLPDAFALARVLPGPARVVDVGSGGGLPAIPLALLRPPLSIDLCEPIAKKVAFLRTAVRELGLGGRIRVQPVRAEALGRTAPLSFDVAISRATLPPAEWLAFAPRLVVPGGRVFALTTPAGAREVATSADLRHAYLAGERVLLERAVPRETSAPPGTGPSPT